MYKFLTLILGSILLFNLNTKLDFISDPVERAVFHEINKTRLAYGLDELIYDENLSKLAREKSIDLATSEVFSHNTNHYKSTRALLLKYPYPWLNGSENLIKGTKDPEKIANSFINSKEHLENILNPTYEKTGIGLYISSDGTPYLTQLFLNPLF